jgi:hypothetical protein
MPNWCENKLQIKGKAKQVSQLLELIKTEDDGFDFNKVIPYPEKYKLLDAAADDWEKIYEGIPWGERPPRPNDGYNSGGYDWCIANWGTKWSASDVIIRKTTRGATIDFTSPWSPPTPVVLELSKMFPECIFDLKFWECGMGFKGQYTAIAGDAEEWEGNYSGRRGG